MYDGGIYPSSTGLPTGNFGALLNGKPGLCRFRRSGRVRLMVWSDYLPLLIPLIAGAAIVYALAFEKPRRLSPKTAKQAETAAAIACLEAGAQGDGPSPSPPEINARLQLIVTKGGPDHLLRLSRVDPAFFLPLGNAPALLFRAVQASEGDLRDALTRQRDALLKMMAAQRLTLWREMVEEDPASIELSDERLDALAEDGLPDVLPVVLAEMSDRETDPNWRAVRLSLVGLLPEFHPDHPDGPSILRWFLAGIASTHPRELDAAIGAFPTIAADHRFDPTAEEAAFLRDRAIALAGTDLALDRDTADALGEGLHELTALTHVDAGPVGDAALRLLHGATHAPDAPDFWPEATQLMRKGSALVQALPFAALCVESHPDNPVVSAAAWLAIEQEAKRLRRLGKPNPEADSVICALLANAPEAVVSQLVSGLEAEPDLTPNWSDTSQNLQALAHAQIRPDLSESLRTKLEAISTRYGV